VSAPKKPREKKRDKFIKPGDFIAFAATPECPFNVAKVVLIRQHSMYVHFHGMTHEGPFVPLDEGGEYEGIPWCQSYWHTDMSILHWGFKFTKNNMLKKGDRELIESHPIC
jgi:hypothetical protein